MPNWSGRWSEPRFALAYDTLYPATPRVDFFVGLARGSALEVLDVGCGTGRLACELAGEGHRVTGADPSPVMLDIARRRPGGEDLRWIEDTAATLDVAQSFDLVIMTGHVFQIFLDDHDAGAALGNIRRHLAPGGRLGFETRNPAARPWEQWQPEEPRRSEVADLGVVESYRVVEAVDGELVSYRHHLRFGDDRQVTDNVMRFVPREGVARLVEAADFDAAVWYGDWDRSPVTPGSPELIVVASVPG